MASVSTLPFLKSRLYVKSRFVKSRLYCTFIVVQGTAYIFGSYQKGSGLRWAQGDGGGTRIVNFELTPHKKTVTSELPQVTFEIEWS